MSVFKNFFISVVDLFYPRHCAGCQKALSNLQEREFLCHDCWDELEPIIEQHCQVCSYQFASSHAQVCSNCAEREIHFVAAVAPFHYRGLTRELLARYKYGRDQSLKPLLKKLIVMALDDERLKNISFSAVVPIPLHGLRERERGFNQALPLAKEIARQKNLPLQPLVKRVTATSFQAGFNREKRLKNLENAFALRRPLQLHGNYLLVDDVLTTGTTLSECAKVLLEGGASGVWGVTLAR